MSNPPSIGIAVVDGGGGVFEECEVVAAGQAGVAVRGGAHPRLERCRVHHTSGIGLSATGENSALEAVGCEVYEVRGSGVQITSRATTPTSPTAMCTAPPPTASRSTPTPCSPWPTAVSTTSRRTRSTCGRAPF
ncbi:hypothetical protein SALBM311S_02164 [Streptomyces alboniger]